MWKDEARFSVKEGKRTNDPRDFLYNAWKQSTRRTVNLFLTQRSLISTRTTEDYNRIRYIMSSLRLALKQSLQETGHLIKDKKKRPGKKNGKSAKTSSSRRHPRQPGDPPRKRGRPRKHRPKGDEAQEGDEQGGSPGEEEDDDEESESENEFSYDSEEEEEDESDEEGEEHEADDTQDRGEGGIEDPDGGPAQEKAGKLDSDPSNPAAPPPTLAFAAEDNDSDEQRRRKEKLLFKQHLQQAANKIQAQWKKKAGLSTGEESDNDGNDPGERNPSTRSLSPTRKQETPSKDSTPTSETSDTMKPSKSKTVPPPDPEVFEWNRALTEKKSRKHIAKGLRVKVRFAAKVKREGKVVKKRIWYGGRVAAVAKDGSKLRIKYDDGTSEISKFPDKDVVIDDTSNGEHAVPAYKFIPPSMRKQAGEDPGEEEEDQEPAVAPSTEEQVDDEPQSNKKAEATIAQASSNTSKVAAPVIEIFQREPTSKSIMDAVTEPVSTKAAHVEVKEVEAPEPKEAEPPKLDIPSQDDPMDTEEGEISTPKVKSTETIVKAVLDAADRGELSRDLASPEDGELSPGFSLVRRNEPSVEKPESAVQEESPNAAVDVAVKKSENTMNADTTPAKQESDSEGVEAQDSSKDVQLEVTTTAPKFTIHISNKAMQEARKLAEPESEEELDADTPVTERKIKSIKLKPKAKRKRGAEGVAEEEPSKKKSHLPENDGTIGNDEVIPSSQETPKRNISTIVETPKPVEESNVLVDTPQPDTNLEVAAPELPMPLSNSDGPPSLPALEPDREVPSTVEPKDELEPKPAGKADSPGILPTDLGPDKDASLNPKPQELHGFMEEQSHVDVSKDHESLHRSKDSMDSFSGARSGRKAAQEAKERMTPKQEEKTEKKKKKRKRKEGEEEAAEQSDSSVDDRQWVQCDSCSKWRVLPSDIKVSSLPKHWYCHLNSYDPKRNNCAAPEQSTKQAAKEWRKIRKRIKQQRLVDLHDKAAALEDPPLGKTEDTSGSISPKAPSAKKIKRSSPITMDELGPDAPKLDKKAKKGKATNEEEDTSTMEVDAPKKPGRKRGRPARNQPPQKENEEHDNVEWVQCEKCDKWRKLPPHISTDQLPEKWFCKMNNWNPDSASCSAPEDKADATHHEVGTFAGMFGTGAGKNSYRALIFGTGKKHNRPMSERARAAESLFMKPVEDVENAVPTVMYSSSSCFVPRTSNFTKACDIEEEKPPGIFDVLKNSDIFSELRGMEKPMEVPSSDPGEYSSTILTFTKVSEDVKLVMREIVLRCLGDVVLSGDELVLSIKAVPWESLVPDLALYRPYFNADIIINTVLSLVQDGVVEMTSFRNLRIPIGQWTPRYRKVRSIRAIKIEESIRASRSMKISKPWKQKTSEWVTGANALS